MSHETGLDMSWYKFMDLQVAILLTEQLCQFHVNIDSYTMCINVILCTFFVDMLHTYNILCSKECSWIVTIYQIENVRYQTGSWSRHVEWDRQLVRACMHIYTGHTWTKLYGGKHKHTDTTKAVCWRKTTLWHLYATILLWNMTCRLWSDPLVLRAIRGRVKVTRSCFI